MVSIIGLMVVVSVASWATPMAYTIALPPCAQEDSSNCYWDATLRGNGRGQSFVNINGMVYSVTFD